MKRVLPPVGIIYFWLVPLAVLIVVSDAIPSEPTRLGLAVVAVIIGLSAQFRRFHYPAIGTPFFILLLANYYQAYLLLSPLVVSAMVLVGIPLTGLLARRLLRLPVEREHFLHWLVLGFIISQINSLLAFWPFSFFENSLISLIAYYFLWQVILLFAASSRRSLVAHFVFTTLAAIVAIGALLWLNFPQFR
jgi:hypothetical protein